MNRSSHSARPQRRSRVAPWGGDGATAVAGFRRARDRRTWHIAAYYAVGAGGAALAAAVIGGMAWLLLWMSAALLVVAAAYCGLGERVFRKDGNGRMSLPALWLLAPYLAAAWVNSRAWTRHDRPPIPIRDGVWIGRFPSRYDLAAHDFASVVDLAAELPAPVTDRNWQSYPSLDLVTPRPRVLREAATAIERCRSDGRVLVCCALGYARSAAAVATWLVMTGRSPTPDDALAAIRVARPRAVLLDRHCAAIREAAELSAGGVA